MAALKLGSPLTPEREEEVAELQAFVDSVEEPVASELSAEMEDEPAEMEDEPAKGAEKKPSRPRGQKELANTRVFAEEHGVKSSRENEAGYMTRHGQFTVMPFIVNQRDEPTCVYVTLAKTLVYNLIGIMMNIDIPYSEKVSLNKFMHSFQLDTSVEIDALLLSKYKKISTRGYIVISLFFYFFHWIRREKFKPYYVDSVRPLEMAKQDGKPDVNFEEALTRRLYPFLNLTIERLGGITFAEDHVVLPILRKVRGMAGQLEWKRTSLCTLNNKRYSRNSPTFIQEAFDALCETILYITRKGVKIILTLFSAERGLHDVMLAGIEGKNLLISNSWGHTIDVTAIEELPRVSLRYEGKFDDWMIFQFTFLLPILSGSGMLNGLEPQYDLTDFGKFQSIITTYDVPTFTKLEPILSGGTRKRRNKTKRRFKKSRYRI
jgi:hypothetical protein